MAVNPALPGAQTPPSTPPAGTQGDPPKPADGTDTGAGDRTDPKPGDDGKPPEKTFTQAELNDQIERRLTREREQSAERDRVAKEKAEGEALAAQSKFKELSESQATQLEALNVEKTRLTTELEASNAALTKHLEVLRKDIPAHIIKLLDRMTPAEQLDYIADNAAELKPGNGTADPPKPAAAGAVPATPKPGETTLSDEDRRKQAFSARQAW